MSINPYKYLGPLDPENDKEVCIPRIKEVHRVIRGIAHDDYWVVLGSRLVGKTTFLRQIIKSLDHSTSHSLYINFEISPGNKEEFYQWMTQQFIEKIPHTETHDKSMKKKKEREKSLAPELNFFYFLEEFKPKDKEKQVVLLFDEIEYIPPLRSFLNIWRKVYHERHIKKEFNKYIIILTGAIDLLSLSIGPSSPFNIAETIYLRDFSHEEASQLIDTSFKKLEILIDEKIKKNLIEQVGGHPQLLQQSCSFLVQRTFDRGKSLTERDVNDAVNDLLNSNSLLFTLRNEIENDGILRDLIKDILKGRKRRFLPFKEYSISGAGSIVKDENNLCDVRNEVYKKFLKEILPHVEKTLVFKERAEEKKLLISRKKPLIKKESKNNFDFHPDEPMACAIKQIKVRNYHGIIKTDIQLPVDAKWIFLTGENAYGKTAILRALAIGLFGLTDQKTILLELNRKSEIDVEIYINDESLINSVGTSDFKPFTRFAAYGPSRLEIQSDRTMNEITGRSTKAYSLFNDDGVSLNIERELVLWYLDTDPKYAVVRDILLELMPHGADITVDRVKKEVLYIEKESEEDGGASFKPVRFREMAAGNKSIIAMIGDLVVRFYKEYETLNPDIHPKDFEGIVIIDELDLHLHPKWLWRLPGILSNVFPKIQFIASTHSEISLLGAPKESVFLKVTRTQKQGIQVQRLSIDIKNLLSHHLLTSPIFDMEEESIQAGNDKLSDVRTEGSFKKIKKIDKIKKELRTLKPNDRERLKSLLEDTD
jgi:predicted ATP-binding protein involved in virulence